MDMLINNFKNFINESENESMTSKSTNMPELENYGIKELRDGILISDIKKNHKWILKGKLKNAVFGLSKKGNIAFYSGTWEGGDCYVKLWINGHFENGSLHKCTWKNGIFDDGVFYKGIWFDGEFNAGVMVDTDWRSDKEKPEILSDKKNK
jgi:hypothetical protein